MKTLSDKDIEKSTINKIALPEMTKSTKNASNKIINFNYEVDKNSNDGGIKKTYFSSNDDKQQINFKILNESDKHASKNIFKDLNKDLKVESKLIPKTKDHKIPLQITINKLKTDLKFPNSSRVNDTKAILEANFNSSSGLKKELFNSTPKGVKKVTKK